MIAEIIAGVSSVASLSTIIWLVHGRIRAADQLADARMAQGDTESHVERLQFELETATKAFNNTKRRAKALEGMIYARINRDIADGRSPDDVDGRVLSIVQMWGADDGDEVPADSSGDVHHEPAAATADAAPVPAAITELR